MRTLSLGDRGKEVADIQQRLHTLGFELGGEGLDGFFGPHTAQALRTFQQRRGLLVDGIVGDNTWRELVEAGHRLGDRLLYLRVPHFRGDDVLQLQVKLNLLGFNAGPERGIFDQGVDRSVKEFQQNAGLLADGFVGGSTLAMLDAVRKTESGGMSPKIPERDAGFVSARRLTGQTILIDAGHGGRDTGYVSPFGLAEKDYALRLALRLAELLRAEGCRVRLTRERDESVDIYTRTERADAAGADYVLSLHTGGTASEQASAAACYYFRRGHYFSEHGRRLADYVGRRLDQLGLGYAGALGRNFAVLREPLAISLVVEPLFLTCPRSARAAGSTGHYDAVAGAIVGGLADYLARSGEDTPRPPVTPATPAQTPSAQEHGQ